MKKALLAISLLGMLALTGCSNGYDDEEGGAPGSSMMGPAAGSFLGSWLGSSMANRHNRGGYSTQRHIVHHVHHNYPNRYRVGRTINKPSFTSRSYFSRPSGRSSTFRRVR